MRSLISVVCFAVVAGFLVAESDALDGGSLRMTPRSGWRAFEVITVGDNPTGDGDGWQMPGTFDGLGAWTPDASTLRFVVNHEISNATISQVDLDLAAFKAAIASTRVLGAPTGPFVDSARQAFDRFSATAGQSFVPIENETLTGFARFCSGQSYAPDTFGPGRGFVDEVYVTGEEVSGGDLVALDLRGRDLYRLSGVTGDDGRGRSGMPSDSWENAALIDTGETDHVALFLSPDGGSRQMKLYVGQKGKGVDGQASNDFLARNGLAYGSYYYLNDALPGSGTSTNGFFDTTSAGALESSKLEDVDTNPNDPTQVVLGDQNSGLFTFDFDLAFGASGFDEDASGFSLTKVLPHVDNVDDAFGDADNVDWSAATTLGGVAYPEGLLFVNEDTGTDGGEVWMTTPEGSPLTKIADTIGLPGSTESTGILDISGLVGYEPGSVVLTNNQGSNSSLTTLIHPDAQLASADFNEDGVVDAADYTVWRDGLGTTFTEDDVSVWRDSFGAITGVPATAVPEPAAGLSVLTVFIAVALGRRGP